MYISSPFCVFTFGLMTCSVGVIPYAVIINCGSVELKKYSDENKHVWSLRTAFATMISVISEREVIIERTEVVGLLPLPVQRCTQFQIDHRSQNILQRLSPAGAGSLFKWCISESSPRRNPSKNQEFFGTTGPYLLLHNTACPSYWYPWMYEYIAVDHVGKPRASNSFFVIICWVFIRTLCNHGL